MKSSPSPQPPLLLQWFAAPAPFVTNVDVSRIMRDMRSIMCKDVFTATTAKAPGLGLSLQINTYFDSWLKPLLTAFCLLDVRFWATSGGVWHSYVDQLLVYLLTNERTLCLPLVNALRARINVLLGELQEDREHHAQDQHQMQRKAVGALHQLQQHIRAGSSSQQLADFLVADTEQGEGKTGSNIPLNQRSNNNNNNATSASTPMNVS